MTKYIASRWPFEFEPFVSIICGPYHVTAQPTIIEVRVKPRSGLSKLVLVEDGKWLAQLKAAPVAGKANQELIALVAAQFGCRKSAVTIKSGLSGRTKLVRIEAS